MLANAFKPLPGDENGRRFVTLFLVMLIGVSLLGWAWAVRSPWTVPEPAPLQAGAAVMPEPALPPADELARALGGSSAAPETAPAQRFKLLGVIAGASGRGAALIAVDGQPPRPFALGAEVAPGFVLQRLAAREVTLAESMRGPARLTLPLPAWEPRSSSANAAPGTPGAAPPGADVQGGAVPPPESTAAQPARRGDQRGP